MRRILPKKRFQKTSLLNLRTVVDICPQWIIFEKYYCFTCRLQSEYTETPVYSLMIGNGKKKIVKCVTDSSGNFLQLQCSLVSRVLVEIGECQIIQS